MNLKEALAGKITTERRSFDVIGDIAVIEIPKELQKKQKTIANALFKVNPHIKAVAKKTSIHKGRYRTQTVKIIAGDKRTTTEHKESGIRVRLDINNCYFSPRLSSERLRIARQIKPGEKILVMFSGVGIYPLVFAHNAKPEHVTGIEINPSAHKYAQENVKLNKLENKITLIKGDARKKTILKYDRIVMPLPKTAEKYLDVALKSAKKGTIIHLYTFTRKPEELKDKIPDLCKKYKKKCSVTNIVKAGEYAPRVYRICVDFTVAAQ